MSASPNAQPRAYVDRLPRLPLDIQIWAIAPLASVKPHLIHGRTINISTGGLGAVLLGNLDDGQEINLGFRLPDMVEAMELWAVVRHRTGYRYGVQFLALAQEHQVILAKHCGSVLNQLRGCA